MPRGTRHETRVNLGVASYGSLMNAMLYMALASGSTDAGLYLIAAREIAKLGPSAGSVAGSNFRGSTNYRRPIRQIDVPQESE